MPTTLRDNLAARIALIAVTLLLTALPFVLPTTVPSASAVNTPVNGAAPSGPPPAVRRTSLQNPLGTSDIKVLVGRAVNGFLGLSGSFALLMFVYGSFTWITSGGSPEKIARGKKIFTYAVIGLIVIFGSYAFLSTFINSLGEVGRTR